MPRPRSRELKTVCTSPHEHLITVTNIAKKREASIISLEYLPENMHYGIVGKELEIHPLSDLILRGPSNLSIVRVTESPATHS